MGLVAAACFSELGHHVICVDNNNSKIKLLKKKIIPFYEPDLEELVKKNLKHGSLIFSSCMNEGIKGSEVIFLAVGTPPHADGSADLTAIENVARLIAGNLNSYKLIVEKSTVPVQTGQKVKETICRYRKNNNDFDVASNPEFLREGKAIYDFFYPDRIVLGVSSKRAEQILRDIYYSIKTKFVVTDINTAELIKHASNSFLAAKISFINAVSRICDLAGADVKKVALAMGLDKRIGPQFLEAGAGYGGSCFPKDVEAFIYISKKLGYDFNLLKEVREINKEQRYYFVEKIKEHLWVLKDKKVAVLGLSFKPDTDDMRESPAIDVVSFLFEAGAKLTLYDPRAKKEAQEIFGLDKKLLSAMKSKKIRFAANPYEAVKGCDCVCFLTEWEELKKIDFKRIKKLARYYLIADGRNMFKREELTEMGFEYIGLGR